MALNPLKAVLRLDTVQANRNARRLRGEIRGVDGELRKADASSRGAAGGMGSWATAGIAAAAAVGAAIGKVVSIMNQAIEAQNRLASNAFGVQGQVAGAATQFGLSPSQTVGLLGPIGQRAGVGEQGFSGLSSLATGAASAGLIGQPTVGAGGVAQFPGQGASVLETLSTFTQRIGEPGLGGPLARLVSRGVGGQAATQANVTAALGDIQGAFLGSESSSLGAFITGAITGTAGLSAQGVSQQRLLSTFGAVVKQTATERQAGELLRITGDKFFTGDDPSVVAAIDAKFGEGSFFRMKEEDPDALFGEVLNTLLGTEGAARAELFKKLGITSEVGARLANLQATRGGVTEIRERMRQTTGDVISGQLETFRESGVSQAGAVGAGIATRQARFGEGRRGETFAARKLAEAEREGMRGEDEFGLGLLEFFNITNEREQEALLTNLLRRTIGRFQGETGTIGGARVDITPEGVEFRGGRPETRALLRSTLQELSGGVSAQQVIINQNGPESRTQNNTSKATTQPSGN